MAPILWNFMVAVVANSQIVDVNIRPGSRLFSVNYKRNTVAFRAYQTGFNLFVHTLPIKYLVETSIS